MTLEEKYAKAIEALREIADRTGESYGPIPEWDDGYCSGVRSCADEARDALKLLGEI